MIKLFKISLFVALPIILFSANAQAGDQLPGDTSYDIYLNSQNDTGYDAKTNRDGTLVTIYDSLGNSLGSLTWNSATEEYVGVYNGQVVRATCTQGVGGAYGFRVTYGHSVLEGDLIPN